MGSAEHIRRRTLPRWTPVVVALASAFGFRWLSVSMTSGIADDRGWAPQVVFLGVALCAGAVAGVASRLWSSPAATILFGVLAGLAATRFEDNLLGASVGLLVGLMMATAFTWRATRWTLSTSLRMTAPLALGFATGAGMGASWMSGGPLGPLRAAGVAFSSWLVFLALSGDAEAARPSRRWTRRFAVAAALVAGLLVGSEPLLQWFSS